MTNPRLVVGAAVAVVVVLGAVALALDDLRLLMTIVGIAVVAGAALNLLITTTTMRQLRARIDRLDERQQRFDAAMQELTARLDDETRPLPPEHVEQLLRTVRASIASVETAQAQLVEQVEARLRGAPSPDD